MRYLSLVALLACTTLPAQTGSFTNYGSGCKGTGGNLNCPNANGNATTTGNGAHNSNVFALEGRTTKNEVVFGMELLSRSMTSSPLTITVELYYADSAGKPLFTPATTGTMVLGTKENWYRGTFKTVQIIKPNTKFFVSYKSTTSMQWPYMRSGGTRTIHYWHPANATNLWNGPFTSVPWNWRLVCAAGGGVPQNNATGVPKINASFSLDLTGAKANATSIMILGVSNTTWNNAKLPLSLAPQGAPGCSLLASMDVLLFTKTDAGGKSTVPVQVPNSTPLVGLQLYNQWAVNDTAANAWGFAFSPGGAIKVGK